VTLWLLLPLVIAVIAMTWGGGRSPLEGREAPGFRLPIAAGEGSGSGDRIDLESLRGSVVLLDFWAHWCAPCRRTVPILNEIHERYQGRGLVVLGVNVEDLGPRRLMAAHAELGAGFPTVQDATGEVSGAYGVTGLPTLVVIDRQGSIRAFQSGVPDPDRLDELVSELLR